MAFNKRTLRRSPPPNISAKDALSSMDYGQGAGVDKQGEFVVRSEATTIKFESSLSTFVLRAFFKV
jgi:hypothetical protein